MTLIPKYDTPQTGAPVALGFTPQSAAGATPDAFGAGVGQEQQRLGATLQAQGDRFAQEAQAYQRQENEADSNNAVTQYLVKQSALQEEFKLLQGKDPKNALAKYTSDLQALRAEMRGSLNNPEVQRMFDSETTRQFGYAVMNAGAHAATQFKQYQNNEYNAKITATVHSVSGAQEQQVFEKGLKDIETAVRGGEFKGQSEEVIQGKIRDEQGKAWNMRLADVAKEDPAAARAILAKNRAGIDGIVAQNAESFINKMDSQRTSKRIAESVSSGGATDTMEQKVDYAMSYLTSRYGKAAAAAFVGNMRTENDGLDPRVTNATGHEGIVQWDLTRRTEGKAWAEKNGKDWYDFKTQVQFIDYELQNKERATADKLKGINDPRAAAAIVDSTYERSEGNLVTRRQNHAESAFNRTVMPIATIQPGNRGALESAAVAQANKYADEQKLDNATREDLVANTKAHIDSNYSKQMATNRDAAVGNRATLVQAVTNGPDGKNPLTSIDQVAGPQAPEEIRSAYLTSPPEEQKRIRDMISRNAAAAATPTVATEETKARMNYLRGLKDSNPDEFLKVNTLNEKLTRQDLSQVARWQNDLIGGRAKTDDTATNVERQYRMLQSGGYLNVDGLRPKDTPNDPRQLQFKGALAAAIDEYNLKKKELPNEKEIKEIAQRLLQEQVTGKTWYGGDYKQPAYQVNKSNNPPAYRDIPQTDIDNITQGYQKRFGVIPDQQTVRQYYQKLQRNRTQANAQ